mmetsp:Transcript_31432/g.94029  ORF Transcript_31432/g.94029 Transcript_31432/m.94029 type:complete len:186 (-) Transcript_31432:89-646(-)
MMESNFRLQRRCLESSFNKACHVSQQEETKYANKRLKQEQKQESDKEAQAVISKAQRIRQSLQGTMTVRFSHVEIRQYSIIIGDHPMCMSLPLSLGWEYDPKTTVIDINLYEELRGQRPHRTGSELVLSYYERRNRIRKVAGLTEVEIFCAERQFLRDKRKNGMLLRPLQPSGAVFVENGKSRNQ